MTPTRHPTKILPFVDSYARFEAARINREQAGRPRCQHEMARRVHQSVSGVIASFESELQVKPFARSLQLNERNVIGSLVTVVPPYVIRETIDPRGVYPNLLHHELVDEPMEAVYYRILAASVLCGSSGILPKVKSDVFIMGYDMADRDTDLEFRYTHIPLGGIVFVDSDQ